MINRKEYMKKISKNTKLLKTFLILISYFVYDILIGQILSFLAINDIVIIDLTADIIYFLFMVLVYRKKIKQSYYNFIQRYYCKERLFLIVKWVLILYGITILGGILTQVFFPNLGIDDNTQAIYSLYETSTYYTIFKIVLFSTIIESIIYIDNIKDIISNKIVFVIISGLFYAFMNVAYANLSLVTIIDFIQSFLMAVGLSIIYIKSDDNIVAVMFVKLTYNLIPLTLLILSAFNIN